MLMVSHRELKHLTNLILNMQEKIDSLDARMNMPLELESVGHTSKNIMNSSSAPSAENPSRQRAGPENLSLLDAVSPPLPAFSGPTSSNFSFDIAKNILKRVQGS